MGNDGGSIPSRRELVREAARNPTTTELKQSQHEQQEYHWSTDPLSQKPLSQPVVSDCNGKLYNKDSLWEYLLLSDDDGKRKAEVEKVLQGAIKGRKDVVDVKFTSGKEKGRDGKDVWICPVTNETLGAGAKAVYLVPCGHAFSASAVKELSGERCFGCDQEYASNDVIPILPTAPEDIARLSLRIESLTERGLTHSLKKMSGMGKKRKKQSEASGDAVDSKKGDKENAPSLRSGTTEKDGDSGIKNAATASLTARVMQEQEERKKRRKAAGNENLNSLFSKGQNKDGKNSDFMSRGFAIPTQGK